MAKDTRLEVFVVASSHGFFSISVCLSQAKPSHGAGIRLCGGSCREQSTFAKTASALHVCVLLLVTVVVIWGSRGVHLVLWAASKWGNVLWILSSSPRRSPWILYRWNSFQKFIGSTEFGGLKCSKWWIDLPCPRTFRPVLRQTHLGERSRIFETGPYSSVREEALYQLWHLSRSVCSYFHNGKWRRFHMLKGSRSFC